MASRDDQGDRKGLLDLPKEIRNHIYWLVLDPRAESGTLGNTKILCLCKQVYEEAIVYLKPFVPVFRLGRERHRPLFRDPKANGKPNTYMSATRTSDCYSYQRLTMLEAIRFTNIQLVLNHVRRYESDAVSQKLVADMYDIVEAIKKTTHLHKLAILVAGAFSSCTSELLEACKELVSACGTKHIAIDLQYG